jgi:hypothetical protein
VAATKSITGCPAALEIVVFTGQPGLTPGPIVCRASGADGGSRGGGGGGVSVGCLGGTQEFRRFHRGGEVERSLPGRSGTHVAGVRCSLARFLWMGVLCSVAPLGLVWVAGGARADARAYRLSRLRRWSRTLAGGRPQPRCGWDRMGTVIQGSLASSAPLLRLSRARQTLGYSPVCLDP